MNNGTHGEIRESKKTSSEKRHLIVVNGPPGVGKSTVCNIVRRRLAPSVWLDGDWCWMMSPFRPPCYRRKQADGRKAHGVHVKKLPVKPVFQVRFVQLGRSPRGNSR